MKKYFIVSTDLEHLAKLNDCPAIREAIAVKWLANDLPYLEETTEAEVRQKSDRGPHYFTVRLEEHNQVGPIMFYGHNSSEKLSVFEVYAILETAARKEITI